LRLLRLALAPLRFIGDRVAMRWAGPAGGLAPGRGGIVDIDGEKLAAYRDEDGELHALSPICTHLRCVVGFNQAERTWDCPCHGSRFDVQGEVLRGPATRPLEARELS
jgi:Rieske Fe-S protein